uniref:Uncharacterized protein n=2 Tax=Chrysotila carterae TaxID=13221 RepID=A0A7S4FAG7_CHRCT
MDDQEYLSKSASDAFVGIFLSEDHSQNGQGFDAEGRRCFSSPVRNSAHPLFHKCCDFGEASADSELMIAVADADFVSDDDLIGTACIGAVGDAPVQRWVTLAPSTAAAMKTTGASTSPGEVEVFTVRLPGNSVKKGVDRPQLETVRRANAAGANFSFAECGQSDAIVGCACESRGDVRCTASAIVSATSNGEIGAVTLPNTVGGAASKCVATVDAASPDEGSFAAQARCLRAPSPASHWALWRAALSPVTSAPSRDSYGDAVEAKCGRGQRVVSCAALTTPFAAAAHSLGLTTEMDDEGTESCVAIAGDVAYHSGVRAQAVCAPSIVGSNEILKLQVDSDQVMDMLSTEQTVECPNGFSLTGCACFSDNDNCLGASFEGDTKCKVSLRRPSAFWTAGGRAVATCLYNRGTLRDDFPWPLAPSVACVRPDDEEVEEVMEKFWLSESAKYAIAERERSFYGAFFTVFFLGGVSALVLRLCIKRSCGQYQPSRLTLPWQTGFGGTTASPITSTYTAGSAPTTTVTGVSVGTAYAAPALVPAPPGQAAAPANNSAAGLGSSGTTLVPLSSATTPLVQAAG